MREVVKLRAGKRLIPVTITTTDSGRHEFKFPYNPTLLEEIKNLQGRKWHGFEEPNPRKIWSAPICSRNDFVLAFLKGENVFQRYDAPLMELAENLHAKHRLPLYKHQEAQIKHILSRRQCILAAEMGTGKTRSFIEACELLGLFGIEDIWYVGPKAGVKAVNFDLQKWGTKIRPRMLTYEGLVKLIKTWASGQPAPKFICFDESSKIKTPESQRSQAAMHVAEWMRKELGDEAYIVEMSGTPSPKSPLDWWHQAEVACPGFLKESSRAMLQKRLCLMEQREGKAGGMYPHIVTWLDDEKKCAKCGKWQEDAAHNIVGDHPFESSSNEVSKLHARLQGLVLVQYIDDCLDLPSITYRPVVMKPSPSIIRTANVIKKTETRAITALSKLRQLSDGFKYTEVEDGEEQCKGCGGTGKIMSPVVSDSENLVPDDEGIIQPSGIGAEEYEETTCPNCGGPGTVKRYRRDIEVIDTPKDQALKDELDMVDDIGRVIIWGGFTGTIDKLVRLCQRYGWTVLRVDGRGYHGFTHDGIQIDSDTLLKAMDNSHPEKQALYDKYPKVAFVGQPQAGGMALTLTASPLMVYYSNDFSGEARMQSERRFKRGGMATDRPITVVDFYHLQSDRIVVNNLKKKKKLQNMTMGQLRDEWVEEEVE